MADLHERISQLEAELATLKAQVMDDSARGTPETQRGPTSRRQLLKLAGAAAAGAAGASLLSATPAGATVGTMMFGTSNNAGTDVTELISSTPAETLGVLNTGTSAPSALLAAMLGLSANGYGLIGVGGLAPLLLPPSPTTGSPTTGTHASGEFFVDSAATLFQCVGNGTPGTWVRVGFNPLTPVRILDTRFATGGITGPLTAGQTVNLTVAGMNGVPAQASAVVMNATVAEPTAASFLTIWPQGVTRPLASNLNWTPGQIVPNLATVKLGTNAGISIFNNLGDVQVILDLAGFYS